MLPSSCLGSPPRMRGKHAVTSSEVISIRITPADAGKTALPNVFFRSGWDHPRGCGENCLKPVVCAGVWGSPPRMRGKLRYNLAKVIQIRITPADAGKTWKWKSSNIMFRDHPRGCGENVHVLIIAYIVAGSPPRMRGKPFLNLDKRRQNRITPADAGKTLHKNCRHAKI